MSYFPIDSVVTLHNLKNGYNGTRGIVRTNRSDHGRQKVNLILRDNSRKTVAIKIKPKNMKLVSLTGFNRDITEQSNVGIAKDIKRGSQSATEALASRSFQPLLFHLSFEHSGILQSSLNFLKRCNDETLDDVMSGVRNNPGGNVKSPSLWIELLVKASEVEPSCKSLIAKNIGPLVKCMSNDTERLFFKNNMHWREGIMAYVMLVLDILGESMDPASPSHDKKTAETLLEYEDLLSSIIQWGFWGKRPDIEKELDTQDLLQITDIGFTLVNYLVNYAHNKRDESELTSEGGKRMITSIGCTPIINKDYDSTCMVSLTAALVHQLARKEHFFHVAASLGRNGAKPYNRILELFIIFGGCIDKGVILEVIDFGTNHNPDLDSVELIVKLSRFIVLQEISNSNLCDKPQPSDSRAAFAIRAGMIEMCLTFLESFGEGKEVIGFLMQGVFLSIYDISLHQKTTKAIRSKRQDIEDKLASLEHNIHITSSTKCMELVGIVRSTLDIQGTYCCRCNKELSRTGVKQCNGCGIMVYCSKACQKEDWLDGGHKLSCCKSYTHESAGLFQGRLFPTARCLVSKSDRAATKVKDLEKSMTTIQLKLFLDHSDTILTQAMTLGIPLYDCVVRFDLRECPPTVTTKSYTEWFDTQESMKGFEESRSKENIMCVYKSNVFYGEDESDLVGIQRFFPLDSFLM